MVEVSQSAASPPATSPGVEIRQLPRSFESLGRLVHLLAGIQPFSHYDLGNLVRALEHQLHARCHLAALSGGSIVGYLGWMETTRAIAAAWVEGNGPLRPAENADAVALTIVVSPDPRTLAVMMRHSRNLTKGRRAFYKREYVGALKPARKSSVANVI